MALEMPEPYTSWVTRLPAKYQLPYKFQYVASMHEGVPMGFMGMYCLKPDTPHFINKMERFEDLCVIVNLLHPLCNVIRLPEHHSEVVSDDVIEAINTRQVLHSLTKKSRPDTPGVFDVIIE
jgi:hypothetical protein